MQTKDAGDRLDALANRIDAGLAQGHQKLHDSLAKHAIDVVRAFSDGGKQTTAALDAKLKELDETIIARSGTLAQTLSERAREINDTLGDRADEIAGTLDTRIGAFRNQCRSSAQSCFNRNRRARKARCRNDQRARAEINETLAAARRNSTPPCTHALAILGRR